MTNYQEYLAGTDRIPPRARSGFNRFKSLMVTLWSRSRPFSGKNIVSISAAIFVGLDAVNG